MNATEYVAEKAQLDAWNQRDKDYQRQIKEAEALVLTLRDARARNKAQYAEKLAKVQAYEKEVATKDRMPHPTKPNVVVETVTVVEKVQEPVTFGRALKKVFTGR